MSPRGILIALTSLFLLTSSLSLVAQKKPDPKKDPKAEAKAKEDAKKSREAENASKALKNWINEDVGYIITDTRE